MTLSGCGSVPSFVTLTPISPSSSEISIKRSLEQPSSRSSQSIPSPYFTIVSTANPSPSYTIKPTIEPSPNFTKTPTTEPTTNVTNPSAIASWFNQALKKEDLSPFEFYLPDPPLIWIMPAPDGLNGGCEELLGQWCDISKSDFLKQISLRINKNLSCFYSGGSNVFTIEVSGWDPKWPMPDWERLLGEVDRLQLSFNNHGSSQGEYSLEYVTFLAAEFLWRAKDPCP
jgi:hypothetical protein